VRKSHQEIHTEEIDKQTLDHIYDPIAKLVWEKWIAEGKARLIDNTPGSETYQTKNR
jgi:hypothetical protein